MDTDAVPALAAAGALGVLVGRVVRGRGHEHDDGRDVNARAAARPVTDAAVTAGRVLGSAAATVIKAGGVAVQTVGAAVAATGNLAHAAGERVESAVRPAKSADERAALPTDANETGIEAGAPPANE